MAKDTQANAEGDTDAVRPAMPSVGRWKREDLLAGIAEIERRKNAPEYIEYVRSGAEGAAEARRQINEQERRWLDEAEGTVNEMPLANESVKMQNAEGEKTIALPGSGMSDAEFADLLTHIERRKNKPGYFERWEAQVAEYRQQIQAQAERELAQKGK